MVNGTVYILDDDPDFRAATQALLETAGHRVKTFTSSQALRTETQPEEPGCMLLDLQLGAESGLAAHGKLLEWGWRWPVIFVSGHGTVTAATSALLAGAFDFLEKPIPRTRLLRRVTEAVLADQMRRAKETEVAPLHKRFATLTKREREVAERIERGLSSKQIAHDLSSSIRTVEHHRSRILRKMEVANSAELTRVLTLVRVDTPEKPAGEAPPDLPDDSASED